MDSYCIDFFFVYAKNFAIDIRKLLLDQKFFAPENILSEPIEADVLCKLYLHFCAIIHFLVNKFLKSV